MSYARLEIRSKDRTAIEEGTYNSDFYVGTMRLEKLTVGS